MFAAIATLFTSRAELTADWKIYMPFDEWPTSIIETPGRVYFMSRTYEKNAGVPERSNASHSLFYYDKAGDEIISVNARNQAYGNAVACMAYNCEKKYLLVVYTDSNIDFIYDDGRIFNLPALKASTLPGKKAANSITFDAKNNRAYIATSFGYITLNDDKHEVAESRNYGEDITSIARCGRNIVLCTGGNVYFAPESSTRFNFTDFTQIEGAPVVKYVLPLQSDSFAGYTFDTNGFFGKFSPAGDTFTWEALDSEPQIFCVQEIPTGYRVSGNVKIYELKPDGSISQFDRPKDDWKKPVASYDGKEIWVLDSRKGIRCYDHTNKNALKRDFMRPNAPATYVASSMAYHPDYGMLVGSNGPDLALWTELQHTPANVSGLKGGFWKEYGPLYTNPDLLKSCQNYFGVAIDPQNPQYVYRGSMTGGMQRINLKDPNDILVFANPSNPNNSSQAFVPAAEDISSWNLCRFTTPQFSTDGTMWTLYNSNRAGYNELWYWPAADRAACKDAASYAARPMKKLRMPDVYEHDNHDVMITLQKNKNMIIIGGLSNGGTFLVYDHNGTPDVTADDRYVFVKNPYDQDGGAVTFLCINAFTEDPESGIVYIMSQRGLFTINPATIFDNPNQVNRIKVARNDGTNLADYLLNEINVNHMSIDGEKRKWFSTSNGLFCTSQDGRTILGEFNVDNSYLPSDNIYATAYNPENNSIMVATESSLVEMFPSGSGGSTATGTTDFRAYPNPVEPDYYGWVRIDNLADGALVKITDSRGGLVKELGPARGGSVEWDVSGLNNTRVSTGVYYIMVSPGSSSGGQTQIQKILVLN